MDKKTKNILIISGLVLGVGAAAIYFFGKRSKKNTLPTEDPSIPDGKSGEPLYADRGFPLKL